MSDQIVLSWDVDVTNTIFSPGEAATMLGDVPLYVDPRSDPVLGQFFGLTVASDVSVISDSSTATRTLTLNMRAVSGAPTAPPPFPCRPITARPPVLPYPLRSTVTLAGSFFVQNGSTSVQTSATQKPALAIGDKIQFLSQQGVFYQVNGVSSTTISITAAYTGTGGNTSAFKEIAAPATNVAIYSSSDLDTNGIAVTPAIPAGSGARTVTVHYKDSTGAGPFTTTVSLRGRCPSPVTLAGGVDIAEIENIEIATSGGFNNSVGQITLAELSEPAPAILSNRTPADFAAITDATQLLIDRALAYLPPSYFALSAQGSSQAATPVPPTDTQLSALVGAFVATEVAGPPLNPPLIPSTVPVPTFLSGLFTHTIRLALAGAKVTPQQITLM